MPLSNEKRDRLSDGARLFELREQLGLSQREMAREFGVTSGAIAHWETGQRPIAGSVLRLMSIYEQEFRIDKSRATSLRSASYAPLQISRASRQIQSGFASATWLLVRWACQGAEDGSVRQRVQAHAARRYAMSLARLRSLAMKLGQMLTTVDFMFPEAEQRILSALAPPQTSLSTSTVVEILFSEFGRELGQLFEFFDRRPAACGSVGQVHEARDARGRRLAVKVQYPKIEEAIRSDLHSLATLEKFYRLLSPGQRPGEIFPTMASLFLEECDYEQEARSLVAFRSAWAGDPDMRFPELVEERSSRRVLTTTWCDGVDLFSFARRASAEERNRAGATIWRFYWQSKFRLGMYNTDPNPGNFVFGQGGVQFVDFGRVQRVTPAYVAKLRAVLRSMLERDRRGFDRGLVELGVVSDSSEFDFDYAYWVMLLSYLPSLNEEPFQFGRDYVARLWRAFTSENKNRRTHHYTSDMVFLNQLAFGVNGLLARLGATFSTRPFLLDVLYTDGEARPEPFTAPELDALRL
jgi:predicted unusual protein kinase regulating ubiquinone biosynthesis (AarF/ABC1/UbiB family)/DNA-binding XRE family transcriptional regulator